MQPSFVWFELASAKLATAKKFYQDMFGWEMNDMGGYVMATASATKELGMGMKDNPGKGKIPSHWTPYVSVENTKTATAKAMKLGAKVLHDTHEMPTGIVSVVLDPTGAPLALWSPLPTNPLEPRTTKEIVKRFYDTKKPGNSEWRSLLADEVSFKGTGMPSLQGKASIIAITEDLLARLESAAMKHMLVEGDTACVLNNYQMLPSNGETFTLQTAEIARVKNGKIISFDVYFDTAASQMFMAKQGL